MQRRFGHTARLVTLHSNELTFPEDICLRLPLPRRGLARVWRTHKRTTTPPDHQRAPILGPRNPLERLYFRYDDFRRKRPVSEALVKYSLEEFDVIHYDGGLDLFRDNRIATRWKREGKKIVCHYMGSDLRFRGLNRDLDEMSDLNLTNESDHLLLHPNIHYIYIPFDASAFRVRDRENARLRIIHSPSNRDLKGTRFILPVIEKLRTLRDIEFVLVENLSHDEVLRVKATCDIAIEQVGNLGGTGYGRNSLETLAMGIPTITEMTPDYVEWLPENPFILATPETLLDGLIEVIDNAGSRKKAAVGGRAWVEKYHSFDSVHQRLMTLYSEHGII
ncbi:MAG TPA: hypothetical protein VGA55_09480 [Bacteroidota bacterium]